jgi:hypothetical protein
MSDAALLTRLNRHVRDIRLPRSAANLNVMHSRLEIERGDRRCGAVVLAINVDLAFGRYRDDEFRRPASPRLWNVLCRLRRLRRLPRRLSSVGSCRLLRFTGGQALSLCRRAGFSDDRVRRQGARRGLPAWRGSRARISRSARRRRFSRSGRSRGFLDRFGPGRRRV